MDMRTGFMLQTVTAGKVIFLLCNISTRTFTGYTKNLKTKSYPILPSSATQINVAITHIMSLNTPTK